MNKSSPPNKSDSWVAPEHTRLASDMKRFKYGIKGEDGLYVVCPGERVMPEAECLRFQRDAAKRLRDAHPC